MEVGQILGQPVFLEPLICGRCGARMRVPAALFPSAERRVYSMPPPSGNVWPIWVRAKIFPAETEVFF